MPRFGTHRDRLSRCAGEAVLSGRRGHARSRGPGFDGPSPGAVGISPGYRADSRSRAARNCRHGPSAASGVAARRILSCQSYFMTASCYLAADKTGWTLPGQTTMTDPRTITYHAARRVALWIAPVRRLWEHRNRLIAETDRQSWLLAELEPVRRQRRNAVTGMPVFASGLAERRVVADAGVRPRADAGSPRLEPECRDRGTGTMPTWRNAGTVLGQPSVATAPASGVAPLHEFSLRAPGGQPVAVFALPDGSSRCRR